MMDGSPDTASYTVLVRYSDERLPFFVVCLYFEVIKGAKYALLMELLLPNTFIVADVAARY